MTDLSIRARRSAWPLGPAALAVALAAATLSLGLRGGDVAAQVFRAHLVSVGGLVVWDGAWYGGIYPLSYSVLAPVLVALLGVSVSSAAMAGLASWAFDRLIRVQLGRRTPGVWYFAASTVLAVAIGQITYLAGEAVALCALVALARRRPAWAVILAVLSALFSPLAAAFLVMVLVVWGWHRREQWRVCLVAATATAVAVGGLGLLFPGDGPFPFGWGGLVVVEALCLVVISPLVVVPRAIRLGALVYGLATLASFVVSNPLGGNATRLAESVGIPLVATLLSRPVTERTIPLAHRIIRYRWSALACLVPFVIWQWAPASGVIKAAAEGPDPANSAPFYAPLLAHVPGHGLLRIEVVPTLDHWESVYVGGRLILARGWERQADVKENPLFYSPGALTASSYHSWLINQGVSYVALPHTVLDYAGVPESRLLESGKVKGLSRTWRSGSWTLWKVQDSPGMVSGPASLTALGPDHLTLQVSRPGRILVRVGSNPFWNIETGSGCIGSAQGWTVVEASAAGTMTLDSPLLGGDRDSCQPAADGG